MVKGLGGLTAKKKVSTYFNYFLMVHEWKDLSKGVSHLEGDIRKKEGLVHKHDIESIQEEMKEIDRQIDRCEEAGYKLGFRNLLLFRKSIFLLRFLGRSIKDNLSSLKPELVALSKKITDKKIKHILDKLVHRDIDVDKFCEEKVAEVIALAHTELQREQRAVLADMIIEKGKTGVSMIIRGNARGLIRRMQIRWGPLLREKRDLRKEAKAANVIEGELTNFKNKIDQAFKVLQNLDARVRKRLIKELRRDEKELRSILDRLKKLFEIVEDMIKASYKVFLFDMMLLADVAEVIPKQGRYDQKLMEERQIPRVMTEEDLKRLQEDQKEIHERLQNLRKFLLQLWNYVGVVGREAKKGIKVAA